MLTQVFDYIHSRPHYISSSFTHRRFDVSLSILVHRSYIIYNPVSGKTIISQKGLNYLHGKYKGREFLDTKTEGLSSLGDSEYPSTFCYPYPCFNDRLAALLGLVPAPYYLPQGVSSVNASRTVNRSIPSSETDEDDSIDAAYAIVSTEDCEELFSKHEELSDSMTEEDEIDLSLSLLADHVTLLKSWATVSKIESAISVTV